MTSTAVRRLLISTTAAIAVLPTTAVAQVAGSDGDGQAAATAAVPDAAGNGLGEIVVTARKRSESLISVPVAVTAITQLQLRNNDVTDLGKLAEAAPQVIIGTASTGTGALLTIRGISSSPLDAGLDQSVSVAIDGVQLSRGRIITSTLFDMRQVEVLSGPQALFFGKNSPAGVISIHSANPTDHLEGYFRTGFEFKAYEKFVEGAISGPITDTLKVRLAGRGSWMDGWIRNRALPTANPFDPAHPLPGAADRTDPKGHDLAGRLTVQWKPDRSFDATLKLTYDTQRVDGGGAYGQSWCAGGVTTPMEAGLIPDPYASCKKNMTKAVSALPPEFAVNYPYANGGVPYQISKALLGSLTLNKRFDGITLTSTTGYYHQTVSDADGYDWSSFTQVFDAEHEKYNLFTEELRATSDFSSPLNFTAGFYYEHSNRPHFNAPFLMDTGINPATGNYTNNEQIAKNHGSSVSVFGQLRWKILPSLELAGGARWTHETKYLRIGNIALNPGSILPGLRAPGDFITGHYKDSNVSPEVTLTWHPTPSQTLYAAYKTGYKSGGFSNVSTLEQADSASTLEFGPEKAKGFEIGYKAELLDRRLRVGVTAYRYKYSGLQVSTFNATTISYKINNAASARIQGIEGSLTWLATPRLTFNANLGYNHARFLSFPNAQCNPLQLPGGPGQACHPDPTNPGVMVQDLGGKPLVRAPDLTFDLGATYRLSLGPEWIADLSLDGAYTGSYQTAEDENPLAVQPAFWRLNAAIHLHPVSDKFEIAVIGRNLTNSYYIISANERPFGGPNEFAGWFGRPREVVLQAEVRF